MPDDEEMLELAVQELQRIPRVRHNGMATFGTATAGTGMNWRYQTQAMKPQKQRGDTTILDTAVLEEMKAQEQAYRQGDPAVRALREREERGRNANRIGRRNVEFDPEGNPQMKRFKTAKSEKDA